MEQLLKAIADPIRLKAAFLLTLGELCICDLYTILKLPQTTVSRHMQYMKKRGWVLSEKRGRWMYYRLAPAKNEFHMALLKAIAQALRKNPQFHKLMARRQDWLINEKCKISTDKSK